ncbi:MAG: hypothetical protein IJ131_07745 [Eggerthellaceae bacterium]|nr:hypothetical protein [Eggerthellaceae bacterium]
MVDGTYEIKVDTSAGTNPGTVKLRTVGKKVQCEIDAPVVGKQRIDARIESENSFSAQGTFRLMLVVKVEYALHGSVEGDTLHVAITSSKGDLNLVGNRVR